jgi:hypothetical protein
MQWMKYRFSMNKTKMEHRDFTPIHRWVCRDNARQRSGRVFSALSVHRMMHSSAATKTTPMRLAGVHRQDPRKRATSPDA